MKKYKKIELICQGNGPFATHFIYMKNEDPLCVFGRCGDVCDYMENKYINYVMHRTIDGKSDFLFRCTVSNIYIFISSPTSFHKTQKVKNNKFRFTTGCGKNTTVLLSLRRIPKKWIPEYDEIIEEAIRLRNYYR